MKHIILFFAMLIASFSFGQDRLSDHSFATRSEVMAQNGMAAIKRSYGMRRKGSTMELLNPVRMDKLLVTDEGKQPKLIKY